MRKKQCVIYRGKQPEMTVNFSSETVEARRNDTVFFNC